MLDGLERLQDEQGTGDVGVDECALGMCLYLRFVECPTVEHNYAEARSIECHLDEVVDAFSIWSIAAPATIRSKVNTKDAKRTRE